MRWIGRILFHEIEEQADIFGFQENQLLFHVAFVTSHAKTFLTVCRLKR